MDYHIQRIRNSKYLKYVNHDDLSIDYNCNHDDHLIRLNFDINTIDNMNYPLIQLSAHIGPLLRILNFPIENLFLGSDTLSLVIEN